MMTFFRCSQGDKLKMNWRRKDGRYYEGEILEKIHSGAKHQDCECDDWELWRNHDVDSNILLRKVNL